MSSCSLIEGKEPDVAIRDVQGLFSPFQGRFGCVFLALKGRNNPAQGIALGDLSEVVSQRCVVGPRASQGVALG